MTGPPTCHAAPQCCHANEPTRVQLEVFISFHHTGEPLHLSSRRDNDFVIDSFLQETLGEIPFIGHGAYHCGEPLRWSQKAVRRSTLLFAESRSVPGAPRTSGLLSIMLMDVASKIITESPVAVAVAAAAVFCGAWYYAVNMVDHDDDDEVYTAFFHPTASPVATPHAFLKILDKMPAGSTILDLGVGSGVYLSMRLWSSSSKSAS